MVIMPGAFSSITSTVTGSTVEVLGGLTGLVLLRVTFFALARVGIAVAKLFVGFDLATVRFAALPRAGSGALRPWLRVVDFLFRRFALFFR
jgi:uncharacterized membrane protein YdfJ with MMPL/SSD domain